VTTAPSPIRISIVDDYEIVVAGVAALLAPYSDRVVVVELDSRVPTISDVDLVLYDTFGQVQGHDLDIEDLLQASTARVVIFSWNVQSDLVAASLAAGAAGYISKALSAPEIVTALERIHSGKVELPPAGKPEDVISGNWPGREHGLSPRESEILALITQGLSNQEIADRSYLSINSIKTYIRSAYRKIGVTRRAQAVIWGINHGFEPDRSRTVEPNSW